MAIDPSITAEAISFLLQVGEFAQKRLSEAWKLRGNISEEKYAEKVSSGVEDPLSSHRGDLIKRTKELLNEMLLYVPEIQRDKFVALFEEARAKAYEATTPIQLEEIGISLDYLKNRIDNFKKQKSYREVSRLVAVILSAVLLVVLVIFLLLALAGVGSDEAFQNNTVLGIPAIIILWSMFGSFVAIPMQFNKYVDAEVQDMLRWALTRPVTGIAMGIILYLTVKLGIVIVNPNEAVPIANPEFLWLAAFIGGLSDPLADRVLGSVINRFGGKSDDGIVKSAVPAPIFNEAQIEVVRLLQELKELRDSMAQAPIPVSDNPTKPLQNGHSAEPKIEPEPISQKPSEASADADTGKNLKIEES